MRIFEWKNKRVTDSDLFVKLNVDELNELASMFPEIKKACVEFDGYYVFINSEKKTIIPLRMASMAFGGMYNGSPPYGNEVVDATICFEDLTWQPFTEYEIKHDIKDE